METLINACNLHVGGGVQVATSFIHELTLMDEIPNSLHIWVSTEVDSNLRSAGACLDRLAHYKVINLNGLNSLLPSFSNQLKRFSKVFTVFGPLYVLNPPYRNIVGFAQPWIAYPSNEAYGKIGKLDRIFFRIKFYIQRIFFRNSSFLVVELADVRNQLIANRICKPNKVTVVHNCLSGVFLDVKRWQPIALPKPKTNTLKLGFLGRNYPHKNIDIFPRVALALKARFDIDCTLYVTFTPDEWKGATEAFRANSFNVGVLTASQCPSFYQAIDGVFFPSLLECFSATPLEALFMHKPLFASNRTFVRDTCDDHAFYFDPLNPDSAADVIGSFFTKEYREFSSLPGHKHALKYANPSERAKAYLKLIMEDETPFESDRHE